MNRFYTCTTLVRENTKERVLQFSALLDSSRRRLRFGTRRDRSIPRLLALLLVSRWLFSLFLSVRRGCPSLTLLIVGLIWPIGLILAIVQLPSIVERQPRETTQRWRRCISVGITRSFATLLEVVSVEMHQRMHRNPCYTDCEAKEAEWQIRVSVNMMKPDAL